MESNGSYTVIGAVPAVVDPLAGKLARMETQVAFAVMVVEQQQRLILQLMETITKLETRLAIVEAR